MATITWLGAAVPIPEKQTVTLALTWATGDTLELIVNSKSLLLTAGSTATVTQVAADAVDMINGAAANDDETRSALGTSVGEWVGLTATSAAGVVTVTGAADGRPIGTITATATTAGDGNATQAVSIAADGPGNVNNADNWNGGVPDDDDDIVFDHSASGSCLYTLEQLAAVAPASITITKGFRHQIGLPETNQDNNSLPYDEPNETYFQVVSCADVKIESISAQMIKIDTQSAESHAIITGSGSTVEAGTPPVLIKANHASSTVAVRAGSVGLNYEPKTTGQIATGYVSGTGVLEIGDSTTIATLTQRDGSVVAHNTITTVTVGGGTFEHRSGTITTLTLSGGTVFPVTNGTYTTVNHNGGVLDCTRDTRTQTITNYSMLAGTTLRDPLNTLTFTNGMDIYARIKDVTLEQAPRTTYSISAI